MSEHICKNCNGMNEVYIHPDDIEVSWTCCICRGINEFHKKEVVE